MRTMIVSAATLLLMSPGCSDDPEGGPADGGSGGRVADGSMANPPGPDGGADGDIAKDLTHDECRPTADRGCTSDREVPGWECCPVTIHKQFQTGAQCLAPSDDVHCFATTVGRCSWGNAVTCYSIEAGGGETEVVLTDGFFQERDEVREIGFSLCDPDLNQKVVDASDCGLP